MVITGIFLPLNEGKYSLYYAKRIKSPIFAKYKDSASRVKNKIKNEVFGFLFRGVAYSWSQVVI